MPVSLGGAFRYDLVDSELDRAEEAVVEEALLRAGDKTAVGVVVPFDALEANFGRTGEQRCFDSLGEKYDFSVGMGAYEPRSVFIYTVDVASQRVAHVKRLVWARWGIPGGGGWGPDANGGGVLTGIEPIDDRLRAESADEQMELRSLLAESNLSVQSVRSLVNVATNFTTGRADGESGKRSANLSYLAVFQYATSEDRPASAITAYLNRAAKLSLRRVGVEYHLLGGRSFHLPKTSGGYDSAYEAVVIPRSQHNLTVFGSLGDISGVAVIDYPVTTRLRGGAVGIPERLGARHDAAVEPLGRLRRVRRALGAS